MAEINPAEISAIIKKQIAGFESEASLDEVGTVLNVGDGIANVYGLTNAEYGELVEFENGINGMVLNLAEDNVGVVLFGKSTNIREGEIVKRTKKIASLKIGDGIVGRVVNTLGIPIDGKGPIKGETLICQSNVKLLVLSIESLFQNLYKQVLNLLMRWSL